jgi:UDP-3-O-[3-hydroxymyristoyl] glucosamine N-acyltransferase
MVGIPIAPRTLHELAQRHGGTLRNGRESSVVRRIAPVAHAAAGEIAPLFAVRYVDEARAALARGAVLLVDQSLADREEIGALPGWFHPYAPWALAELLDLADAPAEEPVIGEGCVIGAGAIILPRVRLGARVRVGEGAVVGAAGFGFAAGENGKMRHIPQLGGVIVEDDVHIGALCTIASGTIGPTVIGRGVKLDAQVHVGHNCEIGEGTIIAAQTGLAGSVVVGRGVMMGGQVGVADHLHIGEGARIAAKSGVIGDVAPGATVAGYPAVERHRWLRGLAELYRLASRQGSEPPRSSPSPAPPAAAGSARPPSVAPGAIHPAAIIRGAGARTEQGS